MSTTPIQPRGPGNSATESIPGEEITTQRVIAWSSFFFALLQSICSAVVAINGLRLAIGIGALALTAGVGADLVRFHVNWIRIPMIVAAFVGALVSLAIFMHVRYLRNRPASRWRQKPLTPSQWRMERVQLFLSLATLVLIGIEEYFHFSLHHRL